MSKYDYRRYIYKISEYLTLFSTLALTLAFIFSFDEGLGYFDYADPRSFLPRAFVSSFIIGLIYNVFITKLSKSTFPAPVPKSLENTKNPSALVGIYLVVAGMISIITEATSTSGIPSILIGIGGGAFGIYLLLLSMGEGSSSAHSFTIGKAVTLLISALLPLGIVLGNNSNYLHSINSVENRLSTLFCIVFLLYILNEEKILSSATYSKWRIITLFVAEHCGITLSASYIVAYMCNALNESWRFYQMFIVLGISIAISIKRRHLVREELDGDYLEFLNETFGRYDEDEEDAEQSSESTPDGDFEEAPFKEACAEPSEKEVPSEQKEVPSEQKEVPSEQKETDE